MAFLFVADQFWMDASDIGQQPGHFVWADGTKLDAALWASGQPNDFFGGKEICVSLYTGNGNLFDYPCVYSLSFICEVA